MAAREAFQECVQMCPDLIQAWVSWAQFEKRAQQGSVGDHLQRCRSVPAARPDAQPQQCQALPGVQSASLPSVKHLSYAQRGPRQQMQGRAGRATRSGPHEQSYMMAAKET